MLFCSHSQGGILLVCFYKLVTLTHMKAEVLAGSVFLPLDLTLEQSRSVGGSGVGG